MDELLNEHEQGERVRSWLQRNALGLIGGIGLGLAIIYGWHTWQGKQEGDRQARALAYDAFEQQLVADPAQAPQALAKLPAGSPYAVLGGLEVAKTQVEAGKPEDALATLRAIRTDDAALKSVIDQRIARLLIDGGKAEEAIGLLGKPEAASGLEILGDAQAALGQDEAARASYQQALRTLEEGSPQRQLVELKLAGVGGQAADPAAG